MKYLFIAIFSFFAVTSGIAQAQNTPTPPEGEGEVACFWVDESHIACLRVPSEGGEEVVPPGLANPRNPAEKNKTAHKKRTTGKLKSGPLTKEEYEELLFMPEEVKEGIDI